jgi:hypothetical protein
VSRAFIFIGRVICAEKDVRGPVRISTRGSNLAHTVVHLVLRVLDIRVIWEISLGRAPMYIHYEAYLQRNCSAVLLLCMKMRMILGSVKKRIH